MEVIWLLDGTTLSGLRRATQRSSGGGGGAGGRARVPLEAFVTEFYRALCFGSGSSDHGAKGRSQAKTRQLVERVCVLFDLVDVDSAGVIDWVDFTDFCVYIRGRDSGNQGVQAEPGAPTSEPKRVQDSEITRFTEKLGYIDRSSHCHEIRSMRFVKEIDLLVVVEGTAILKIYSAGLHKVGQIEPAISVRKLMIDNNQRTKKSTGKKGKPHGGSGATARAEGSATAVKGQEDGLAVLAVEYIGHVNRVAVACADGYLTVWEIDTYKMLSYTRLKDVQVGLRFCPTMNVLTSWGVDDFNHEILVWDVDTLKILHVLDGHCEPIKDICEVAPPPSSKIIGGKRKNWEPMLVTAGMDGKVVMWNLRMGIGGKYKAPKKLFILIGHYHGVLSLAYSDEHDFVLSAGFDFDANCWDRSTSHLHMKLTGHTRSLIGVVIVEHETQRAVTGDEGGSFRIWDIRRGHSDHGACLQSFSLRNTRASPRTMAVTWRGGLVVAGSKMHAFRAARNVTVGASPSGVWFSSYTGELCVLLREAVLLDASTGQIKRRAFQQTQGREITAFCMDARHKKAVVGDQRGGLRGYDVVTGRWVMSATPHRSEVSALLFIDEDDVFISAGWDRTIQVHDARVRSCSASRPQSPQHNPAEQPPVGHRSAALLRSVVDAHDGDITLMAASSRLGLLATASNDLTVRVWDYGLLRLEEVIVAHRQEITCVSFLDPLPCLATADMTGKVLIWATRPHINARSLLLVIRNTVITAGGGVGKAGDAGGHARVQRKVSPIPVTCITFRHAIAVCTDTVVRGTPQPEVPPAPATGCQEVDESERSPQPPPQQPVEARRPRLSIEPSTSLPEVGSTLFTGDELGSIKAWDVTRVLLDKLGPATCGASRTEDKASSPSSSGGRKTHQSVHHRPGPLDGVVLQAALRFTDLIEIAKALRRGDDLPPSRPEADRNKYHVKGRSGSRTRAGTKGARPIDAKPFARGQSSRCVAESSSDRSAAAVTTATGQSRNRYQAARRRHVSDSERRAEKLGETPTPASPRVAFNVSNGKHRASPESGTQEDVEAVLNAGVDTISPAKSWAGHENSVTSMKMIFCPPSIITGSLDGSARLFSLEGSLLGVMIDQEAGGKAPWLFRPPPHGRKTEASARAAALEKKLRSVRRTERGTTPPTVPGEVGLSGDPRLQDRWTDSGRINPQLRAPAKGCGFGTSTVSKGERSGPRQGGGEEGGLSADGSASQVAGETGGETPETPERVDILQTRPNTSAVCLSRVKELAQQVRLVAPTEPGVGSGRQQASQESIDETLLSEARERYHSPGDISSPKSRPTSRGGGGDRDRQRNLHATRTSREAWEQPTPGKMNVNLSAEHQRKHAKRTRSALQFLSSSISRTGGRASVVEQGCRRPSTAQPQGSVAERARMQRAQGDMRQRPSTSSGVRANRPNTLSHKHENKDVLRDSEQDIVGRDPATAVGLKSCSSASVLGDGIATMAPTLMLRLGVNCAKSSTKESGGARDQVSARGKGGVISLTQRSAATAFSGKSNMSTSAEFSRKLAIDRRHRRMDDILDGVRRIGLREETSPPPLSSKRGGSALGGGQDSSTVESFETTGGKREKAAASAVISTRVREVLSRFDRLVNDDEYNRDGFADPNDQGGNFDGNFNPKERRRRSVRIAARQAAIRHNERYRHAQRFNLTTLQETQQRRQEAMVGLTGPSGERFGPYSLDDVLDFQTFAQYLSAQGADHMTLRGLMDNPGIQADPYSHALLQELARSRVLQWNRALSLEELMQLVFHFAKHEEIKRMASIMDIALLLERVRDAFLADRSSLLGADGVLSSHFANEIDVTVRATGADACGTCTTKDLHGIMARVGSDLFSHGLEDLEALAAQCGIVDGHKELTSTDLTAIILKLISLHPVRRSGPQANA